MTKHWLLLLTVGVLFWIPPAVARDVKTQRVEAPAAAIDACFKPAPGKVSNALMLDQLLGGETRNGERSNGSTVSCTVLPRASFAPRELDVRTPRGTILGFGLGGQLYSIRPAGIENDLIPNQREDSFFVDSVFQTAATNRNIRRTTPRAQRGSARRGPSWHYHQAGTYQRGLLRGRAPYYSPVIFNRFDEGAGIYESLNLAQQAHVENRDPVDRYLVYARFKHLGDDVFEVTQAWINHGRNPGPSNGTKGVALDYFNFPWLVLRNETVPVVLAGTAEEILDLSERTWPPGRGVFVARAKWLGSFTDSSDDAEGMIFTLAEDKRTRLRVGKVNKRVVLNVTDDPAEFRFGQRANYVIGAIRSDIRIEREEAIVARFYLAFGRRTDLVAKAERLHKLSAVRKVVLEASAKPEDLASLCRKDDGHLDPCGAGKSAEIVVTRKVCTACLPLYEMADAKSNRPVYSTDPYLDPGPGAHLVDPRYRPVRIIGWLFDKSAAPPTGMAKRVLSASDPLGIRFHESDVGEYAYFVPAKSLLERQPSMSK